MKQKQNRTENGRKSNILTIMKKEFARFFGDKKLVLTTLFLPGILIYVVYSFMGEGITSQSQSDGEEPAQDPGGGYAGIGSTALLLRDVGAGENIGGSLLRL